MKRIFLILMLCTLSFPLLALTIDDLSLGVGCGYESTGSLKGEFYVQSSDNLFKKNADFRVGISNRTYKLDFDGVSNLESHSIGLFCDAVIYPFDNGFYGGLRWEMINFNWLTADSKTQFENARSYTPSSLYTGTCMFFQIGYKMHLSDKCGFRLYAQPGFQQFRISNGTTSIGNYSGGSSSNNLITEDHYEFIFNINMSIDFRIK